MPLHFDVRVTPAWALVGLAACTAPEDSEGRAPTPSADLVAIPSSLAFGEADQGVAHTLSASIQNVGGVAVEVASVTTGAATLTSDLARGTPIPANGFASFSVIWTPEPGAALDDTVTVQLAAEQGDDTTITLPVTGHGIGPIVAVTLDKPDVGTVSVGCTASTVLKVENLGNAVLRIESLVATGDAEFALTSTTGDALELPWVIDPGEAAWARLTYTPDSEAANAVNLVATTNDVFTPIVELDVVGQGAMDWVNQDELVQEQAIATIVFANEVLLTGYREQFDAALPVFFETLVARGVPFRVAFDIDGEIGGDVPYIDETTAPDDRAAIVDTMLGEAIGTDNDLIFESLLGDVSRYRGWLIDESGVWVASQLNLVGINNDLEQSSMNAHAFIEEAAAYKGEDAGLVTVHAIAGDIPTGCDGADPAGALYDAAIMSGGTFASICDRDWSAGMEALALGMPGTSAYLFALDKPPVPGSLTVSVDGVLAETGWSYAKADNTVRFDEGSRPAIGSVVTLRYAAVCDDDE